MAQSDREYCRALIARYLRAFSEAWAGKDWGMMHFYQRRLQALYDWRRELTAEEGGPPGPDPAP